ncbi:MAG: TIGR03790 family protein [Verrucomicrobiota bacterium]
MLKSILFRVRQLIANHTLVATVTFLHSCIYAQTSFTESGHQKILVIYNHNAPDSKELAEYYAQKRNIPNDRILAVNAPITEQITREQYDKFIRKPLEAYLLEKRLLERKPATLKLLTQEKIKIKGAKNFPLWAIVLIKGVPLKISKDPNYTPSLRLPTNLLHDYASVDSELALIGYEKYPLEAFVLNPYYYEREPRPFNQSFADKMTLVCRLDGPSTKIVKRMIDEPIRIEKTELTGKAYFDARGISDSKDRYYIGDLWITNSAEILKKSGLHTTLDNKGPIFAPFIPIPDAAIYAGWYSGNIAGALNQEHFRFRPGAIAYHLHSFSAGSVRNSKKFWVGPLLSKGACATMGSVYEPYLRFTPNIAIFYASLMSGLSFAEAAYSAQPALSWTMTMVGDPLYRPFKGDFASSLLHANQNNTADLSWLILRMIRLQVLNNKLTDARKNLEDLVTKIPSPTSWEGYAEIMLEIEDQLEPTEMAYQKAINFQIDPREKVRLKLTLAKLYQKFRYPHKSLSVYEEILKKNRNIAHSYNVSSQAIALAKKQPDSSLSPFMQSLVANKTLPNNEKQATTPTNRLLSPAQTGPSTLKPILSKPSPEKRGLLPATKSPLDTQSGILPPVNN